MSRDDPTYARVSPKFWAEARAHEWTDDMVTLSLYLLTCEHRTTEGLYRLPREYMVADLPDGWTFARVTTSLAALVVQGFVQYDEKARVVFLPKAMKYQRPDNGNQQIAAVKNVRSLPGTYLLAPFREAAGCYCEAFAQALDEAFPQGFPRGYSDPPALALALTPALAPTPLGRTEEHCSPLVESASDSTVDDPPLVGELVTTGHDADDGFAAFWCAYPNKQGRQVAERRWKGMKPAERAAATEVATAMAFCVESGYRERDKCPHGSTFLNQRRWEEWRDEDGELRAPPGYGPQENGARLQNERAIKRAVARHYGMNEEDL